MTLKKIVLTSQKEFKASLDLLGISECHHSAGTLGTPYIYKKSDDDILDFVEVLLS